MWLFDRWLCVLYLYSTSSLDLRKYFLLLLYYALVIFPYVVYLVECFKAKYDNIEGNITL